jgi:DNA polymerase mu
MPSSRRPASPSSSYDTERDSPGPNRKRRRLRSNTPTGSQSEDDSSAEEPKPLKVYIVQAKLDADTATELYNIIEGFAFKGGGSDERTLQLQLCSEVEDADVVVTAVRMRRRFERHVEWKTAVRAFYYILLFFGTDSA